MEGVVVSYTKEARPWTIHALQHGSPPRLAVRLACRQCVPGVNSQLGVCHAAMVGCGAVEMSVTATVPFACWPTPTRQGCMQMG
jgi:hypothetical protein